MDQPGLPPVEPNERRKTEEPGFRSGCGCVLGAAVIGLLYWGGVSGLERWLRVRTLGGSETDLIVMAQPELQASAIFWIMVVTLIVAGFALNVRSPARAILQAGVVLALGAFALGWTCYRHFEAMRPVGGSEVELIYLWPRPSERIDVRGTTLSQEMDTSYGGETAGPIHHLIVTVGGKDYSSASSGGLEEAKRFLRARGATDAR